MVTPLVKLFKSPKHRYFYDAVKNEIVTISESLFSLLEMVENGDEDWNKLVNANEEIASLLENGYFSSSRVKTIHHPFSNLCEIFLERKIEKMTLQITQDCNFRCKYCLYSENTNHKQRNHSKKNMTWETAKKAVDFYFQHSIDSTSRNIGFYGGEPLLQFDLIRRIVLYAEKNSKGKPLTFNITTNGSLLSHSIVQFFSEHNIKTLISMDGVKSAQDKNRVFADGTGTYDTIIAKLEYVRQSFPRYYRTLSFNSVLTPETSIDEVTALSGIFNDIPISNFRTNYVENTDHDIDATIDYSVRTEYQGMLAFMAFNGRYPETQLTSFGANWLRDTRSAYHRFKETSFLPDVFAPGGPCLPGKSRLFINADGSLFPCERVNESEHMRIGQLDTGFDLKAVDRLLNIGELTAAKCKNCWAIRHCVICAKMCDDGKKLSAEQKSRYCEKSKLIAEKTLRRIILCRELETGEYSDNIKVLNRII